MIEMPKASSAPGDPPMANFMLKPDVTYVDPPNGHAYGFPKPIGPGEEPTNDWLRANGYPEEWLARWPEGVPSRIIGPWPPERGP